MPRLVVGMPAFNAEATISMAVESTLRAMPRDSELWVYDDKSSDATLEVLARVSDKRLRVIVGDVNRGNGYARKLLVDKTDSEFIAAMDSDDVTFPWRFTLSLRALQQVDIVFGTVLRFGIANPGGSYLPNTRIRHLRPNAPIPIRPEEFPSALLFHCPVYQQSSTTRRSVFIDAGGYLPMRYGEDYELFLRLARSGARMVRLGTPVVAYRYSAGQLTRTDDNPSAAGRSWRESKWAEELPNSYVKLFEEKAFPLQLDAAAQGDAVAVRSVLESGLRDQLKNFRPVNRLRYSSLLRSGEALTWLMDKFFPGKR
jgi:glycosyltransferase involved in cell wall biosynthesis